MRAREMRNRCRISVPNIMRGVMSAIEAALFGVLGRDAER